MPRCQDPCPRAATGGTVLLATGAGTDQLGFLRLLGFPALRLLAQLLRKRFDPLGHRLLLIEILLEELGSIPLSQIFRHLDEAGVHHHLVMLGFLRATDVRHLQHLRRGILLVERPMLVCQSFDAEASRLFWLLTDLLEDLFQILYLRLRLLLVLFQGLGQFRIERFFAQLWQHLQDLTLRAHRIRQLMHEQLTHRTDGHDLILLTALDGAGHVCTYACRVPRARLVTSTASSDLRPACGGGAGAGTTRRAEEPARYDESVDSLWWPCARFVSLTMPGSTGAAVSASFIACVTTAASSIGLGMASSSSWITRACCASISACSAIRSATCSALPFPEVRVRLASCSVSVAFSLSSRRLDQRAVSSSSDFWLRSTSGAKA